ncbi:MAG: hypothetical protein COB76_01195 [Alphaproteobacteria bacterium]|nr:MAG: hypothetical protein COB76_01195 [Alphaproteobacteria bacterium]
MKDGWRARKNGPYSLIANTIAKAIERILSGADLLKWTQDTLKKFNNEPEKINNSPDTAPSKRLLGKTNYKKTVHGPNIAEEIGLDKIRDICPNFDQWLVEIESLIPNETKM